MQNLKNISDQLLLTQTKSAASSEKQATLLLLEHLCEVDRRGLALREGYSSIWDYVHRGLKYSEAAASERVAAMKLLRRVPEAKNLIEEQKLSLTVAAKVQHFVRAIEKSEHRVMESSETAELLDQVAGKSKREVEKLFVSLTPDSVVPRERVREISKELSEVKLVVDQELLNLMQKAKTLFGCANQAETLKRTLKIAIQARKKKLGLDVTPQPQPTQPAVAQVLSQKLTRYVPVEVKRSLWRRAQSQCEFTGHHGRCLSKHKLQIDHIKPYAWGGATEPQNLRLLCQNHNLAQARQMGLI